MGSGPSWSQILVSGDLPHTQLVLLAKVKAAELDPTSQQTTVHQDTSVHGVRSQNGNGESGYRPTSLFTILGLNIKTCG